MKLIASIALAAAMPVALQAPPASAAPGGLDPTFGAGGKVIRSLSSPNRRFSGTDGAVDVETLPDRKVLALLSVHGKRELGSAVVRFRRDGRLDRRFGDDGVAEVRLPGTEYAGGLALQPDGRIVVAFGSVREGATSEFGITRLRHNGRPDRTFDDDGVRTTPVGTGFRHAFPEDVVVDQAGVITAVGRAWDRINRQHEFALARFEPDGDLDQGFSADGLETTDFAGGADEAYAAALDSDGRLLAVGNGGLGECCARRVAVARYRADGELDGSFSGDGKLLTPSGHDGRGVVALPDGSVAVAATRSSDFLVARYSEAGDPDPSFSGDGFRAIDFRNLADAAEDLAYDGGRLVVTGQARRRARNRDFGVVRLDADGTLDRSFSGGRAAFDLSGRGDWGHALTIDPSGDVIVGGGACIRCRRPAAALIRILGGTGT